MMSATVKRSPAMNDLPPISPSSQARLSRTIAFSPDATDRPRCSPDAGRRGSTSARHPGAIANRIEECPVALLHRVALGVRGPNLEPQCLDDAGMPVVAR